MVGVARRSHPGGPRRGAAAGPLIWKRNQSALDNAAPALANGLVLIGSDDHRIHVDDWANGASLFSFATKGEVRSSPILADGRIVVGSNDGRVYDFALPG